jgi:hypothetical integral membrane protein (TIGR02206 family)
VAASAGLVLAVRARGGEGRLRPIAAGLAAVLVANEVAELIYIGRVDAPSLRQHLPFQLCDWVMVACVVALLLRRRLAYEMAYFWGLCGSLQAVLTPDLREDFPHFHFFTFMIAHALVIVTVIYLTLGMRMRPYPRSLARIFAWSQVYLVVTAAIDWALGANYGYLCRKPQGRSLLDALGPWPWYLLSLQAIALAMFALVYAPFALADARRRRAAARRGLRASPPPGT